MVDIVAAVHERRRIMQYGSHAKTYQLHILVNRPMSITIGKLGSFSFPPGNYIYTGSGRKNIEARISRHLSGAKKLRWHIDYLLSNPEVQIIGVGQSEETECTVNQKTFGRVLVPRFGGTDCRNKCGSHLKYLGVKEPVEELLTASIKPDDKLATTGSGQRGETK